MVCFILFIYSQKFNNNVISNGRPYCCNDTFTDLWFTSLLAKNILQEYKLFYPLESAFHYLFCLKFSFKLVTSSKSYVRKHKWLFFSEHIHYCKEIITWQPIMLFFSNVWQNSDRQQFWNYVINFKPLLATARAA